jgi:hypothetical protein
MTRSEIISVIALLLSVISIGFSVFFNFRDRAKIKTTSTFYPESEFGSASVHFTVVNAGRRPIILRMRGAVDKNGEWIGTYLGKDQSGLRLGEHERLDHRMEAHDLFEATPDDVITVTDLWVEDTLGRRYLIKDAKKNLALLLKSKHA